MQKRRRSVEASHSSLDVPNAIDAAERADAEAVDHVPRKGEAPERQHRNHRHELPRRRAVRLVHSRPADHAPVADAPSSRLRRPQPSRLTRTVESAVAALMLVALLPLFALIAAMLWVPGRPLLVRGPAPRRAAPAPALLQFNYPRARRHAAVAARVPPSGLHDIAHFILHTCRGDQLPRLINVLRGDIGLFPCGTRPSLFG